MTVFLNHEIRPGLGSVRAHGQNGAFVSQWTIHLNSLQVKRGEDLIRDVFTWNGGQFADTTGATQFNCFCSGDLPPRTAFHNPATGKGYPDLIYMNGEEAGSGAVRIGFLASDVSQSGAVTIADVLAVNAALSQPVTAGNHLRDVNLSGTLSLADKLAANANLALALPPPVPVAPTCTISPPQSVAPNTAVVLALTDCTAPGGGALSYSWNLGAAAGPQN